MFEKLLGFHFQASSSISKDLMRAYPRSKKNLHWLMIGRLLHIGKNLSIEGSQGTSVICSKYRWEVWKVAIRATLDELCGFYPHWRLETVPMALKLPQNYYKNINIGSHSPPHIPWLKDSPHYWTKHESKDTRS